MRTYQRTWNVVTTMVVGIAMAYDVATGGALRMTAVAVLTGGFAGLFTFAYTEEQPDRARWARRALLWSGLGGLSLDALAHTWSGPGVAVFVLLVLTAPVLLLPARERYLAWSVLGTTGPPEKLGRRDLLRRWEWTTGLLQRRDLSSSRIIALVDERRRVLDELERRDPAAFQKWITSAEPVRHAAGLRSRDR